MSPRGCLRIYARRICVVPLQYAAYGTAGPWWHSDRRTERHTLPYATASSNQAGAFSSRRMTTINPRCKVRLANQENRGDITYYIGLGLRQGVNFPLLSCLLFSSMKSTKASPNTVFSLLAEDVMLYEHSQAICWRGCRKHVQPCEADVLRVSLTRGRRGQRKTGQVLTIFRS